MQKRGKGYSQFRGFFLPTYILFAHECLMLHLNSKSIICKFKKASSLKEVEDQLYRFSKRNYCISTLFGREIMLFLGNCIFWHPRLTTMVSNQVSREMWWTSDSSRKKVIILASAPYSSQISRKRSAIGIL